MRSTDIVTATVEVAVDPATAFAIFTEEIGRWWRPGPINWNDAERAVGIRIEPGVGGRWLEIYDEATGEGFECGRILIWEPGARLVFVYQDAGHQLDGTEVKASRSSTGGCLTLIESHTRGGAPMHVHSRDDECFYVLDGAIAVQCGDERFEAGPRSFVFLPHGIPHAWDVSGEGAATLL